MCLATRARPQGPHAYLYLLRLQKGAALFRAGARRKMSAAGSNRQERRACAVWCVRPSRMPLPHVARRFPTHTHPGGPRVAEMPPAASASGSGCLSTRSAVIAHGLHMSSPAYSLPTTHLRSEPPGPPARRQGPRRQQARLRSSERAFLKGERARPMRDAGQRMDGDGTMHAPQRCAGRHCS